MRSAGAIFRLVSARLRHRPGRAAFTILGLALATAFAGAVAAEGTIAGDRAAQRVLAGLGSVERSVRLTTQDVVTPAMQRQALALLGSLRLEQQTETVLMDPVRLSGAVVRPAAIRPLARWITDPLPGSVCRPARCPVLVAGGPVSRSTLATPGARFTVVGRTHLRSGAPLGFLPTDSGAQPPLLLTPDLSGLDSLPALSSAYRTHGWVALLPGSGLHSWQLAGTEQKLRRAQTNLLASASGLTLTAPFGALDAARAQAAAAPERLLLAGGGAIAALVLFIVLSAGGLRRDIAAELTRLRNAGARSTTSLLFTLLETGVICGAAVLLGAILALAAGAVEAGAAGVPVGPALSHSLLTPVAAVVLVGGWMLATAVTSLLVQSERFHLADALALAAAAALILALSRGEPTGNDPIPVLLAPLACLAAGVLVYRAAALVLRGGERLLRAGPVMGRLALVGLARAPSPPSLAIAFIAVSVGLGGFALSYRATLERSASDQAANAVPLDATVSSTPDFTTPLQLAPLTRWRQLAGGAVEPVRRTQASYVSGGSSVTVPALGVPAAALTHIHGWREADGSAPLATLARRLVPSGPSRRSGPSIPAAAGWISLRATAAGVGAIITADLRGQSGALQRLPLGQASASGSLLRARIPQGGPWELEALELTEPTGLQVTNGHQNGENPAAATRYTARVTLGEVRTSTSGFRLDSWRGVGAATGTEPRGNGVVVRFASSGETGVVRPPQPSDTRPVPVLADALTAAASGRGRRLGLSVDGQPVMGRVVGVLKRFPALGASTQGFVVADEPTLSGALDAQAPGQGSPDELWIDAPRLAGLRAALGARPLSQLAARFRADAQHALDSAPISSAVLATLVAATVVALGLAVLGLLVALMGAARDERVERDLVAQGAGPRLLRRELRLRLTLAGILGVVLGVGLGALLTRLAVASVRAAGTVAAPDPPLVTVAPWGTLAIWGLVACVALLGAAWMATTTIVGRRTA